MRKHFLLLFLMAILPLAGWAQVDIKTFEFEIEESSYAYSAQAPVIEPYLHLPNVVTPLALGTDYELKYYNANGSEWTGANPPVNVGTYMVGAHGIGSYTGYTDIKVTYYITPKNINDVHVVNQQDVADLSVTNFVFTACRTTQPAPQSATYDGAAWNPTATVALYGFTAQQFAKGTGYDVNYGANINAGQANQNKGGSFIVTGKGNFTGTKTFYFDIAKADIPNDIKTAAAPTAKTNLVYNGKDQELVTAGTLDASYGLVKYAVGEGQNAPAAEAYKADLPTAKTASAAGYPVYWLIAGSDNYNDVDAQALANNVQIAKKPATLSLTLKQEEYDGANGDPSAVKINYGGLASSDVKASLTNFDDMVHVEFFTNNNYGTENDNPLQDIVVDNPQADAYKNVNKYLVKVLVEEDNGAQQDPVANPFFVNYSFNLNTTSNRGEYYEITARPIQFTANDIYFDYGTNPIMPAQVTLQVNYTKAELTDFNTAIQALANDAPLSDAQAAALNAVLGTEYTNQTTGAQVNKAGFATAVTEIATEISVYVKTPGSIKLTDGSFADNETFAAIQSDFSFAWSEAYQSQAKTLEGALELNVKVVGAQQNPRSDAGSNYEITTVAGSIKFNKTPMIVYVNSFEKEYGELIETTDLSYTADEDVVNVAYTVWDEDGNNQITDYATKKLTPGIYMIKMTATAQEDGQHTIASIEEGYAVINAKAITIDMSGKTVTVNEGASLATLQQYVSPDDFKEQVAAQVENNDEINYEIVFNTANEAGAVTVDGQTGNLTSTHANSPYNKGFTGHAFTKAEYEAAVTAAGDDEDALAEAEKLDPKKNAFYTFTFVPGKLIVNTVNTLILADTDDELATRIADAAALCAGNNNATVYDVTFERDNIAGGLWNSMVLPFETTVREVSNALGYAVVDLLEESTDGNAHFKLAFGTIPANTPFMVKTDADVVFDGVAQVGNPGDANYVAPQAQVKFVGKKIVTTNIDADAIHGAQAYYSDGYNDFYGIYTPYALSNNTTERMLGRATAAEKDNTWQIWANVAKVKNTRAVLVLDRNKVDARIFIEEPDGTTSIQTLTANGEMVPAEGWYTLNGVKLQAAPTQKGVYINNGKKIVIK